MQRGFTKKTSDIQKWNHIFNPKAGKAGRTQKQKQQAKKGDKL